MENWDVCIALCFWNTVVEACILLLGFGKKKRRNVNIAYVAVLDMKTDRDILGVEFITWE